MGSIWNADFTKRGNPAWNSGFNKIVPDGAAGNQAQLGIFFDDDKGITQRLTEAEGHERAFNPETVERNPIGQEAPITELRSYHLGLDKDIIIRKGAPNYEFFAMLARLRPTGNNAKLRIYLVDFRIEESGSLHHKYYAEMMMVTVTFNTINETDGILSVSFTQDGDYTIGTMERTDSSSSDDESTFTYGFTSSRQITTTDIDLSDATVAVAVGGTVRVAVSFSPLGCPYDFTVVSSDETKAVVSRWNQSIDISGLAVGTATITVASVATPSVTDTIAVTVS